MADKKKIMLVEDEVDLAMVVKRRVESSQNYDVEVVHDGEAAYQAIMAKAPDLLILDINIPKMNGLELYKKICTNDQPPEFPVLIFTARSELEDIFEQMNVDGFISKPFDSEELLTEIDRILYQGSDPVLFFLDIGKKQGVGAVKNRFRSLGVKVIYLDTFDAFKTVAVKSRPDFIIVKFCGNTAEAKELILNIKTFIVKMKELNKRTDIPSILANRIWPISHKVSIIAYDAPKGYDTADLGADYFSAAKDGLDAVLTAVKDELHSRSKAKEENDIARLTRLQAPSRPKITDLDFFK